MSLIIKGSIMPLMCEECPCYDCDDYSCKATGRGVIEYRYDGRPDNCPLVEVPTPHGTLIDKGVAIETFKEVYCGHCKKEIPCFACSVPIALDVLNDIPTIIEAEVSENA